MPSVTPPVISVVIPTYNGERYLAQTVGSVRAQTFADWELIVVDDGSKDGTPALAHTLASQDSRIRLVWQANGGIANARNRGLAEADPASEYIAYLDHDDLWRPNALGALLAAARSLPSGVGAHGVATVIDALSETYNPSDLSADMRQIEQKSRHRREIVGRRVVALSPDQPTTFGVEAYWHPIYTVGQALIRKSALRALGGFDPQTVPCDDWDLWLRLTLAGSFAYTDSVVVGWRFHADNTSGQRDKMVAAQEIVCRKILCLPDLSAAQQALARRCLLGSHHFRDYEDRLHWGSQSLRRGHPIKAARQYRHALRSYMLFRDFV